MVRKYMHLLVPAVNWILPPPLALLLYLFHGYPKPAMSPGPMLSGRAIPRAGALFSLFYSEN